MFLFKNQATPQVISNTLVSRETNPRLADIFVKKGPFLKLYSSYIRNFENATATLEDVTKKNPTFASALREFEVSLKCCSAGISHNQC